jgi:hypothetical protein
MSFNEHTQNEPKRSVYDRCDPQYLRELREAAGMDVLVLARTACLSVAQVRQLERDDSDGLFYSDAIKRQAYKRLLMILGAEPPVVEVPQELFDVSQVADAHLTTLDQIVAMSDQPAIHRSYWDTLGAGFAKLKQHKQAVGALLVLLMAAGLFVLQGPQNNGEAATMPADVKPTLAVAPIELVPVASAATVAPAASAPLAATSATALAKSASCAYATEAMPQLTSVYARKEGRYVYLVSAANMDICVVDGNKEATLLQLKAGEGLSVHGVSPWQVSGANLHTVQIYFQGGRMSLPDGVTQRVSLVEVPVAR